MKIYIIATIRGEHFHEYLKYRVLDIDSGDIKEVDKADLIDAIKKNNEIFENVRVNIAHYTKFINKTETYELATAEGMGEMPMLDLERNIVSRNRYIIISIDEEENNIKLAEYSGLIMNTALDGVHNIAREIAGIPVKYKSRPKTAGLLTTRNREITREIERAYESFILMTRALGLDCSFVYTIHEDSVYLGSYTGTSTHAIVPKFVTKIGHRSFYKRNIMSVSLNDGLQSIGIRAFASNNIEEVDIPKTVLSVDKQAFEGNIKLFKRVVYSEKYIAELDKDKFRVYSENTDIKSQW